MIYERYMSKLYCCTDYITLLFFIVSETCIYEYITHKYLVLCGLFLRYPNREC